MKFSIVTPVRNMERFIGETIESVLSQAGDFEIEYIIMDGGSTDKTLSIIKDYDERIKKGAYKISCHTLSFRYFSEQDGGMYDAINKGFERATGDIYAWINADDIYTPEAFRHISDVMKKFPDISWVKGIGFGIDEHGAVISNIPRRTYIYKRSWLLRGIYGMQSYFVDQVSVFWRRELWNKIQPIPIQYRLAGDYWLWIAFARHEKLWSLSVPVACFRKHTGQLSGNINAYKAEQRAIQPKVDLRVIPIRLLFNPWSRLLPRFHKFFLWLYPYLFWNGAKESYIDIEDGAYAIKQAPSFAIDLRKSH